MTNRAWMLPLALAPMLLGLAPVTLKSWQTAGDPQWVKRDDDRITLLAKEPVTAGVVSPADAVPPGTDAILVSAKVADADAAAITFSVHDDKGDTLGYWQNPRSIAAGTVDTVVPVVRATSQLRVFAGTHRAPSSASLEDIRWEPLRQVMTFAGTAYGALVHGTNVEAQSFKAQGRVAAVRFLVRRMKENDGPDLRVRIYPVGANGALDASAKPLGEAIVARQRIPQADETREMITVALAADSAAGKTYAVEFSTTAPCAADNGFLLWGGRGTFPDGSRFQNGSPVADWDLHMEIYERF